MEVVVIFVCLKAGAVAVSRIEAFANVSQPRAGAPTRGHLGIEVIFYCDGKVADSVLTNRETNPATFGQIRNAMRDGIFEQRLQEQRGHQAVKSLRLYFFLKIKSRTETDLLDR